MTHTNDSPDDEPPLDPAAERVRLKMVRLLLGSLGVMALGLIAVFSAIVYKISEGKETAPPDGVASASLETVSDLPLLHDIDLPEHKEILSTNLSGALLLVQVLLDDGQQKSVIVNWQTGQIIAELSLPSP